MSTTTKKHGSPQPGSGRLMPPSTYEAMRKEAQKYGPPEAIIAKHGAGNSFDVYDGEEKYLFSIDSDGDVISKTPLSLP
jgi:hypothetical protein